MRFLGVTMKGTGFFKEYGAPGSPYKQIFPEGKGDVPLSLSLQDNMDMLQDLFSNCSDIMYREFVIDSIKRPAALVFISGLADTRLINQTIMNSLMNIKEASSVNGGTGSVTETARRHFLDIAVVEEALTIGGAVDALLNGNSVFFLNGDATALKIKTQGWKERSVSKTNIEQVIRGPKEAFTESIYTNTALVRRKIKTPLLKFEEHIVGRLSRTIVYISYLQGIADDNVVKEVRKRIDAIDVDSILESGYIEELIEDTPYTVFPQLQHSERPDKVAAAIMEGRVTVFVDGTPFVLIIPGLFIQFFQSSDDYYERFTAATAIRMIRFIFIGVALLLPGAYVAVILYHKEMIPTQVFISIIQAGHGTPFPILIEALIMEISFEALREAGIRLPGPANQTVGIVGALIIGDAAVRAGIVSPTMVIIISITGVASFSIPSYDMGYSIRILRFFMIILGAFLGLYGIVLGVLMLLIHLASLRSFGKDYLSPIAPLSLVQLKDVVARFPWWAMNKRPELPAEDNGKGRDNT